MSQPYYEVDGITLYRGDCREITDWLAADVLVTDPPYGVAFSNAYGGRMSQPYGGRTSQHGRASPLERIAGDESFDVARAVIELGVALPMAVFASHASLRNTLTAVGGAHDRVRVMTWFKSNVNGGMFGNPWMSDVEFIVCGVPEWPQRFASGVVSVPKFVGGNNNRADAYLHPTQKPVQVMERVIQAMPAGVVADPCAGSGSTLVAARAQGRQAIGVELEERYCEIAARRLAQGVLEFPA